eukprot:scaffold98130_cov39-Phaeocystis_antarctica.AAC.2
MKRDGGLMGVSVVVMSPFKQQQSLLKLKETSSGPDVQGDAQGMWQACTKPEPEPDPNPEPDPHHSTFTLILTPTLTQTPTLTLTLTQL